MIKKYNQLSAVLAIAKASFLAMLRSPTSVVFSILFPVIFIVVFGSMLDTTLNFKLAAAPSCDTANPVYNAIKSISRITIADSGQSAATQLDELKKARITAIIDIKKDTFNSPIPHYTITLTSSGATANKIPLLKTLLNEAISAINQKAFPNNLSIAGIKERQLPGRAYLQIDFILPGQLGFSLLMAGVFGSAFLLFNLRKSLVLKRLSVTPIRRHYLILGEMLSRLFFHVTGFIIMIGLGYWAFNFTLVNGLYTFFEMLLFSLEGLIIFMGIGFIISGVIQNESSIAPVANTITLPQILLCGLFFPIEDYPNWLRSFCNILPLTFFTDGLRKIAFEGVHIWQMPKQITGLTIWAVVISIIASRVFKWE